MDSRSGRKARHGEPMTGTRKCATFPFLIPYWTDLITRMNKTIMTPQLRYERTAAMPELVEVDSASKS